MASDDIKRIEENGDLRVFIRNIESLEDGRLRFHFRTMRVLTDGCTHIAGGKAAPGAGWGLREAAQLTPRWFAGCTGSASTWPWSARRRRGTGSTASAVSRGGSCPVRLVAKRRVSSGPRPPPGALGGQVRQPGAGGGGARRCHPRCPGTSARSDTAPPAEAHRPTVRTHGRSARPAHEPWVPGAGGGQGPL